MKTSLISNIVIFSLLLSAAALAADKDPAVTMEYYYQIKWGHQEEFIELYKKNHLPLVRSLIKSGHMLSVKTERPTLHLPESRRWDYRVTIVFRDADAALSEPPEEWEQAKAHLYPDQDTFKQEESRRFGLLEAHWDVAVSTVELD
jgi:hypothetical protein